jgi:hypothetical protein
MEEDDAEKELSKQLMAMEKGGKYKGPWSLPRRSPKSILKICHGSQMKIRGRVKFQ